jgi:hypothetical protein
LIREHIKTVPETTEDLRFFPLCAHRNAPDGGGKTTVGKAAEEAKASGNWVSFLNIEQVVVHSFREKTTYCLQIVQWACGYPIGWGKCYRSESSPQVLAILDRIWTEHPESKPSFIAYDDACSLLRHIVTRDSDSAWLSTTKFIVDAWHYISHRVTDILCRLRCNPAPPNGSQPDLIVVA